MNPSVAPFGGFGQQPPSNFGVPFGGQQQVPFGGQQQVPFGGQQQQAPFGGQQQQAPFGGQQQQAPFGTQQQQAPFGAQPTPFGTQQQQAAFGAQQQQASFGTQQQQTPFGTQQPAPFGAQPTPFGIQQQQPAMPFGTQQQQQQPAMAPKTTWAAQAQPGSEFGALPQSQAKTNALFLYAPPNLPEQEIRDYLQTAFGPVATIARKPNNPSQLLVKMVNADDAERAVRAGNQFHSIPGLKITYDRFASAAPQQSFQQQQQPVFEDEMEENVPFASHHQQQQSLPVPAAPSNKTNHLYVRIPADRISLQDLKTYLSTTFGPVLSANPKHTNPGEVFVTMQNADDAERAVLEKHSLPQGVSIRYNLYPRDKKTVAVAAPWQSHHQQQQQMGDHDGMEEAAVVNAARSPSTSFDHPTAAATMEEAPTAIIAPQPKQQPQKLSRKEEILARLAQKQAAAAAAAAATAAAASTATLPLPPLPPSSVTPTHLHHADEERENCVVGTCTLMSPRSETQARIDANQIDLLERSEDVFQTAVMKFQRSAAMEKMDMPELIRTEETLLKTLDYLWNSILDIDSPEASAAPLLDRRGNPPTTLGIVSFITDRTKRIRQELELQGFTSPHTLRPSSVRILEECIRFHILVSHEMCERKSDEDGFNAKLNREDMNACFKKLFDLYDAGVPSDYQIEMRAYYLVLLMDSNDRVSANTIVKASALAFRGERSSPIFDLALTVFNAYVTGDYFTYFTVFRNTRYYLLACLMHSGLTTMRRVALEMLNGLHLIKDDVNLGRYPVARIANLFCFDDQDAAIAFLEGNAGLTVLENEYVLLGQHKPLEQFQVEEKTKSMLLEMKRGGNVKRRDFIVNGVREEKDARQALEVVDTSAAAAVAAVADFAKRQKQELTAQRQKAEAAAAAAAKEAEEERARALKAAEEARLRAQAQEAAAARLAQQEQEQRRQAEAAAQAAAAQKRAQQEEEVAAARRRAQEEEAAAWERKAQLVQQRNLRLAALVERFARRQILQRALSTWRRVAAEREVRLSRQVDALARILRKRQLRQGFSVLKQAIAPPARALAFPMLFNAQPRVTGGANSEQKKQRRITSSTWPESMLREQLFPAPQQSYCLVRFDSDLLSCPVAQFGRWCAEQMLPNLVMITPELPLAQQTCLKAVDLLVVIWYRKSQEEIDLVKDLLANSFAPVPPMLVFHIDATRVQQVNVRLSERTYEIDLPSIASLEPGMITHAVAWAQTLNKMRQARSSVELDGFSLLARCFSRLNSASHVSAWLEEGRERIRNVWPRGGGLGPRLPDPAMLHQTQLSDFARAIGCPAREFRRLELESAGNQIWLWEQILLLYFYHFSLKSAKFQVNPDLLLPPSASLLDAWGKAARVNPVKPVRALLAQESEANVEYERKLKAYLEQEPLKPSAVPRLIAPNTTTSTGGAKLQAFIAERVKQEQFIQKMECAQHYGDIWFK